MFLQDFSFTVRLFGYVTFSELVIHRQLDIEFLKSVEVFFYVSNHLHMKTPIN